MPVTKRTRFEVLRRDNHTCRYCGQSAPDVKLTVDHIVPVALGGNDNPSNLATACRDCNAGKSSTSPSENVVSSVEADSLRWAQARRRALDKMAAQRAEQAALVDPFLDSRKEWDKGLDVLPADWQQSVTYWLDDGLTMEQILDALDIALLNLSVKPKYVFRYMAGVCRNKIAAIDAATRAELEAGDGA